MKIRPFRRLLSFIAPLAILLSLAPPARTVSTTIVISQVYGGGGNMGASTWSLTF